MSEQDSVSQVELELARDSVLAVLALYAQEIDTVMRREVPDTEARDRLVQERIAYGGKLRDLDNADSAALARITETACADLARLEEEMT